MFNHLLKFKNMIRFDSRTGKLVIFSLITVVFLLLPLERSFAFSFSLKNELLNTVRESSLVYREVGRMINHGYGELLNTVRDTTLVYKETGKVLSRGYKAYENKLIGTLEGGMRAVNTSFVAFGDLIINVPGKNKTQTASLFVDIPSDSPPVSSPTHMAQLDQLLIVEDVESPTPTPSPVPPALIQTNNNVQTSTDPALRRSVTLLSERLDDVYVDVSKLLEILASGVTEPRSEVTRAELEALQRQISLSQKINSLSSGGGSSVTISSPAISAPVISSGATVSGSVQGGDFSPSTLTVTGSGTSTSLGNTSVSSLQASVLYVTSTTASSTFASGLNLSGGCFAIGGTCVAGSGSSVGGDEAFDTVTLGGTLYTQPTTTITVYGNNGFLANASSTIKGTLNTTGYLGASSTAGFTNLSSLYGGFISGASSTVTSGLNVGGVLQASSTLVVGGTGTSSFAGNLEFLSSGTSTSAGGLGLVGDLAADQLFITGATSTFTNGLNLSTGCFAINGTCVGGSSVSGQAGQIQFNNSGVLGADQYFNWDNTNKRLGIGTSTPYARLHVTASSTPQLILSDAFGGTDLKHWFASSTAGNLTFGTMDDMLTVRNTKAIFTNNGNFGIGTTSPWGLLALSATTTDGGMPLFTVGSSSATYGSTTAFLIDANGNVGIGTSTAKAQLSVHGETLSSYFTATTTYATSTFSGGFTAGAGGLNVMTTGITSISAAELGNLNFDIDAGMVSWADLDVTGATVGTPQGYTAFLDSNPILTISGNSTGGGDLLDVGAAFGTTTVQSRLSVWGATTSISLFQVTDHASSTVFEVFTNQKVGVGTTSPWAKFSIAATTTDDTVTPLFAVEVATSTASSTALVVRANGKVGVGTTTPWLDFASHGRVGMGGLTVSGANQAAYLCISATEEVISDSTTCLASSKRFKNTIESYESGLATVLALRPVTFLYNKTGNPNLDNRGEQLGFIAEEANEVDPRLVSLDAEGLPKAFKYENFTAVLAEAIKELNLKVDSIAGLANSGSSNGNLKEWIFDKVSAVTGYVKTLVTDRITTKELCVDDLCITKSEFKDLLDGAGIKAKENSANVTDAVNNQESGSDSEPPVITMLGNNPATIDVGTSYVDPGATVDDNIDQNLGLKYLVDGVSVNEISLDTSKPIEYSIEYTAEDQAGNQSTLTRKVIVSKIGEESKDELPKEEVKEAIKEETKKDDSGIAGTEVTSVDEEKLEPEEEKSE